MAERLPETCTEADEHLVALAYGELADVPLPVRAHVEACPRCRDELAGLERTRAAVGALPLEEPSDAVDAKVLGALDDFLAGSLPSLPSSLPVLDAAVVAPMPTEAPAARVAEIGAGAAPSLASVSSLPGTKRRPRRWYAPVAAAASLAAVGGATWMTWKKSPEDVSANHMPAAPVASPEQAAAERIEHREPVAQQSPLIEAWVAPEAPAGQPEVVDPPPARTSVKTKASDRPTSEPRPAPKATTVRPEAVTPEAVTDLDVARPVDGAATLSVKGGAELGVGAPEPFAGTAPSLHGVRSDHPVQKRMRVAQTERSAEKAEAREVERESDVRALRVAEPRMAATAPVMPSAPAPTAMRDETEAASERGAGPFDWLFGNAGRPAPAAVAPAEVTSASTVEIERGLAEARRLLSSDPAGARSRFRALRTAAREAALRTHELDAIDGEIDALLSLERFDEAERVAAELDEGRRQAAFARIERRRAPLLNEPAPSTSPSER